MVQCTAALCACIAGCCVWYMRAARKTRVQGCRCACGIVENAHRMNAVVQVGTQVEYWRIEQTRLKTCMTMLKVNEKSLGRSPLVH